MTQTATDAGTPVPSPSMAERRRDLASALVLGGFVIFSVLDYVMAAYQAKGYPFNTFLFKSDDQEPLSSLPGANPVGRHLFGDFYQVWEQTRLPSPYMATNPYLVSNYPPAAHLVLRPLSWLPYHGALITYLVLTGLALFVVLFAALPGNGFARLQAAGVLGFLSYPVLFLLDRGNIDGLVAVLTLTALLLVRRGAWAAPVLLGLAAAVKIYPAVFIVLWAGQRRWRDVVVAVCTAAAVTGVALLTFTGGIVANIRGFRAGVAAFAKPASQGDAQAVQHSTSLAAPIRLLVHQHVLPHGAVALISPTALVLLALFVLGLLVLPLRTWERAFLAAAIVTVPLTGSYDYRLWVFLLPVVLALRDSRTGSWTTTGLVTAALLLVPKPLPNFYADVGLGVLVNPVLVLLLCGGILVRGSREQFRTELDAGGDGRDGARRRRLLPVRHARALG